MEEATGKTPQALLDAPLMFGLAREITDAYNILASRRTFGMAPNPIQLSDIMAFIQVFGPPTVGLDLFVELLGVMDIKYLELSHGDKPTSKR